MDNRETILNIENLTVHYKDSELGDCEAVNNVSFEIKKGEVIGLVGETGAGKTTIALSILRLLQSPPAKIESGKIEFKGEDLLNVSEKKMREVRGAEISMIFQDPMTALNPIDRVGDQIAEVIRLHNKCSKAEAAKLAGDMMESVRIPRSRYKDFPHQFSGGMKQRVVIAMALACSPELLIADEPTTALDVTIQAQVLDMMKKLQSQYGTSVMLITHDLGVVAEMCEKVVVLYAGEIVEMGEIRQIYKNTQHPYTKGLFNSLPSISTDQKRLQPIKGLMPDPHNLPKHCKFADRCNYCSEKCKQGPVPMVEVEPGHFVRCILAESKGENV